MNWKYYFIRFIFLTLALVGQADLKCYDLVRQYYQCKKLIMHKVNFSWDIIYYIPNYSIPNNRLDDSFFQKLGLENMPLNKAMDLFKQIYMETNNCTSEFCNCVNFQFIDTNDQFSIYFRNETNFRQFNDIISAFNNKFSKFMYPIDYFTKLIFTYEFPTLTKFCITNEYTSQRLNNYNNTLMSCVNRNESVR